MARVLGQRTARHARLKKALVVLGVASAIVACTHFAVRATTRIEPPRIDVPRANGDAYVRMRAGVREVFLSGSPEQIGAAHGRLLREPMLATEAHLWQSFSQVVPLAPARALVWDAARVRYRHVDDGIVEARRRELAAQASVFDPDPYASALPTYHRMVFLSALYDIALGFEHSPLIGCTSFGLGPSATIDGHALFARAFDFEAGDVFDREKVIFFVRGDGVIPFASVAWPGVVGVVTGMNVEGVAIAVHGARAGEPAERGVPVIFGLRDVLERAHDTTEAIAILRAQSVMVSHIVFVGDARGRFAVVERAPGIEAWVRMGDRDPERTGVTNHLEGPLASDPKNAKVIATTTTKPRRARLDELLAAVGPREADVPRAVAMLRDHACAGDASCALGDRRAIDALIATHGVVADTTDRVMWVSAGPHLSGKFVRFDLRAVFESRETNEPVVLPEDVILNDGRYQAGRAKAGAMKIGGDAR